MNKNLNIIAKELFGKIRTQFPKIKLGDENSTVTDKPEKARFFKFEYVQDGASLGNIDVSISEDDGLVVIYSNDIPEGQDEYTKNKFFDFLKELREFAKQHVLNFDTRDISKSNLDKRDYEFMSNNIGEGKMTESKLFGTSKTSYQQLGDAKIIVKHSAPVNFDNPAGRTQRIESIYIENIQGERFKYPYKHLNGARALAQHVAHGGNSYDPIGQHIIGLSEELSKLRMFKGYVDRNPLVSEAMGSISSKVYERIDQVKKEIFGLQSPARYEEFLESFEEQQRKEIPEDIMNDWIDRLTIRTFNEELKNVFPYIFKLVDESDIPVKELTIEDLVTEENSTDDGEPQLKPGMKVKGGKIEKVSGNTVTIRTSNGDLETMNIHDVDVAEIKEFTQYENIINNIVERKDIFSDDEEKQSPAIEKLNQLVAQPFPVGADGTNAIESLSDIIDDDELMDVFKELADIDPESDIRDMLKDYIEIKDKENGTDVLSKVTFGEEGELAAEPAAEEPPAEPAAAPAEAPPSAAPAAEAPPVQAPMAEASDTVEKDEKGNIKSWKHEGDWKKLDKKNPRGKVTNAAGQALKKSISMAKKAGATSETIIRIGGKEMTLGEAITKAGMKVEDVFGNKENELIEYIKSMYDYTTGAFPKGAEGVLIACEKKFGDNVRPVAQKVIHKLENVFESQRILKLAGLVK